jgi:hypothetical protein
MPVPLSQGPPRTQVGQGPHTPPPCSVKYSAQAVQSPVVASHAPAPQLGQAQLPSAWQAPLPAAQPRQAQLPSGAQALPGTQAHFAQPPPPSAW